MRALAAAAATASSTAGCSLGGEGADRPAPPPRGDPPEPATLSLHRAPAPVVRACRAAQQEARAALLCPTRLPRTTSDLASSRGVPAEALGASAVRDPRTGAVVGVEVGHASGGQHGEPLRIRVLQSGEAPPGDATARRFGARAGRFDDASGAQRRAAFFWTEDGVKYVASLAHGGGASASTLAGIVRGLRPASELRPRRAARRRVETVPSPVRGPVAITVAGRAVFVGGGGGAGAPPDPLAPARPAVARMSAERLRVLGAPTTVASAPGAVALIQGEAVMWVVHRGRGSPLRMLDPGGGDPIGALDGLAAPVAVAVGHDSVWVADWGAGADARRRGVVRRAPATGRRFTASVPVGRSPAGVATGPGAVWVANALDDSVMRIDPRTNRVVATVAVGDRPVGIVARASGVWVANAGDATVTRIDPRRDRVVATIRAGAGARALAAGGGSVWVANELADTVTRIDARSGRVLESIPVGAGPAAVAYGHGAAWVANNLDGTVSRIEPSA